MTGGACHPRSSGLDPSMRKDRSEAIPEGRALGPRVRNSTKQMAFTESACVDPVQILGDRADPPHRQRHPSTPRGFQNPDIRRSCSASASGSMKRVFLPPPSSRWRGPDRRHGPQQRQTGTQRPETTPAASDTSSPALRVDACPPAGLEGRAAVSARSAQGPGIKPEGWRPRRGLHAKHAEPGGVHDARPLRLTSVHGGTPCSKTLLEPLAFWLPYSV